MDTIEEKLQKLIQTLCKEENVFLEDLILMGGGKNRLLKIIVDTETGISLSQCQGLSKKISNSIYKKDIFNENYQLEVSSPGANKPLEKDYEFIRSVGKELQVLYRDNDEIKSINGELISFKEDKITIGQKKENIAIPLSTIEEAKIKLKW